ncbi:MAG: SH3 domain-containing protein [Bacteroidota bacterium]
MSRLVLFLLLFIPVCLSAQDKLDVRILTADECIDSYDVPKAYMLADEVNVRSCPNTSCTAVAVMRIGQSMKPLERSTEIDTVNGVKSHWYKIESGKIKGWIFGGFIAQHAFGSQTDPSVKFVFGIEKIVEEEVRKVPVYQIRAFRGQTQLDKISVRSFSWSMGAAHSLGAQGLDLHDIISLHVPCVGGCGCSTGDILVFWNGTRFSDVHQLVGIADAWASEGSSFVFPTDMEGEKDMVIKEDRIFLEEAEVGGYKRKMVRTFYRWNGQKLVIDPNRKKEVDTYITGG